MRESNLSRRCAPSSGWQAFDVRQRMDWPPDPNHWGALPHECLWYLPLGASLHGTALLVTLVIWAILRIAGWWKLRLFGLLLFHTSLLLCAMLANGIWSCTVWGRLYWSVDYVSDFSPFYPIRQSVVDYSWGAEMTGALNGITLTQLNLWWLLFAVLTWTLALMLTRIILAHATNKEAE